MVVNEREWRGVRWMQTHGGARAALLEDFTLNNEHVNIPSLCFLILCTWGLGEQNTWQVLDYRIFWISDSKMSKITSGKPHLLTIKIKTVILGWPKLYFYVNCLFHMKIRTIFLFFLFLILIKYFVPSCGFHTPALVWKSSVLSWKPMPGSAASQDNRLMWAAHGSPFFPRLSRDAPGLSLPQCFISTSVLREPTTKVSHNSVNYPRQGSVLLQDGYK